MSGESRAVARNGELRRAADRGDAEAVAELLNQGADPNARNRFGSTALHLAARHGHTAVVEILLAHGALTSQRDNHGNTPAVLAIWGVHRDALRILLERSVDLPELEKEICLAWAIILADVPTVMLLLQAGADPETPRPPRLDRQGLRPALVRDRPPRSLRGVLPRDPAGSSIQPPRRSSLLLSPGVQRLVEGLAFLSDLAASPSSSIRRRTAEAVRVSIGARSRSAKRRLASAARAVAPKASGRPGRSATRRSNLPTIRRPGAGRSSSLLFETAGGGASCCARSTAMGATARNASRLCSTFSSFRGMESLFCLMMRHLL